MRKLCALVFNYSVNGLLADPDTDFWKFCFEQLDEQGGPDDDAETISFLSGAYAHVMGRTAYENMPKQPDNPWTGILTEGRKVVFSRTLEKADWANTTIVAGDTAEEIDKLRQGGDGHIVVWGGVSMWRSLMHLDLIDEWLISFYPYLTGQGTLLFDDATPSHRLDLVSSLAKPSGLIELHYRRHR